MKSENNPFPVNFTGASLQYLLAAPADAHQTALAGSPGLEITFFKLSPCFTDNIISECCFCIRILIISLRDPGLSVRQLHMQTGR